MMLRVATPAARLLWLLLRLSTPQPQLPALLWTPQPAETTAEVPGISLASWLLVQRHHQLLIHRHQLLHVVLSTLSPLACHRRIRRVMVLEDLLGNVDLLWKINGAGVDAGVHGSCTLPLLPSIPMPGWLGKRRNPDRDAYGVGVWGFQG